LKLLGPILVTVIASLAVIFVCLNWIAPVALSFYAAKTAPRVTRVVPQPLTDSSVSLAPGTKLSYFGYPFEIPWTDLDDSLTKLYPQGTPEKNRADLHFRSGLRLVVTAVPAQEWTRGLAQELKVSPEVVESAFGRETMKSDYSFVKALYEFTPARMNHWSAWHRGVSRDELRLTLKSIAPLRSAESGIFTLQNQGYQGFQEGNPLVRQDGLALHLFSEDGRIELILFQKDYQNPTGVTQSEINRIAHSSLHKTPQSIPTTSTPNGRAVGSRTDTGRFAHVGANPARPESRGDARD